MEYKFHSELIIIITLGQIESGPSDLFNFNLNNFFWISHSVIWRGDISDVKATFSNSMKSLSGSSGSLVNTVEKNSSRAVALSFLSVIKVSSPLTLTFKCETVLVELLLFHTYFQNNFGLDLQLQAICNCLFF